VRPLLVSTAVMAWFFRGESMTPIRWICLEPAIAGVLECSGIDWKELNFTSGRFVLGNLMILLSVNGSAGWRRAQLCASACYISAGHAHLQTPFCAGTAAIPHQQHLSPRETLRG
jgi:hypothetical protein